MAKATKTKTAKRKASPKPKPAKAGPSRSEQARALRRRYPKMPIVEIARRAKLHPQSAANALKATRVLTPVQVSK